MNTQSILISAIAAIALYVSSFSASAEMTNSTATSMTTEMSTLASGSWTKKMFNSSGTWEIYAEDGKYFVKLSSDFKTRNAPDLKIFLSPLSAANANDNNATTRALFIAPLTSNSGAQVYEIPAGVDFSKYKSILIHCEQYSKLWSAANLAL